VWFFSFFGCLNVKESLNLLGIVWIPCLVIQYPCTRYSICSAKHLDLDFSLWYQWLRILLEPFLTRVDGANLDDTKQYLINLILWWLMFVHMWEVCAILTMTKTTILVKCTKILIILNHVTLHLWQDWNTRSNSRNGLNQIIIINHTFSIKRIWGKCWIQDIQKMQKIQEILKFSITLETS
jgi:hypothetical protein